MAEKIGSCCLAMYNIVMFKTHQWNGHKVSVITLVQLFQVLQRRIPGKHLPILGFLSVAVKCSVCETYQLKHHWCFHVAPEEKPQAIGRADIIRQ